MLFHNFLSKYFIFKIIFGCNCCFELFTNIKKGPWTSFWCTILNMIFPLKCHLFNTVSIDKVSWLYLFFLQRNQTKCVMKFLFRQCINHKLRFMSDHPLKQWLKKSMEDGNTKVWIWWEWKQLFWWNKKHISKLLKG